jgi:hypothetical protein
MFTGKKPTDNMFQGGLSLHKHVEVAYPMQIMQIIDPILLWNIEGNLAERSERRSWAKMIKCLDSIISLGLICSKLSPEERISMRNAASKLLRIKEEYLA